MNRGLLFRLLRRHFFSVIHGRTREPVSSIQTLRPRDFETDNPAETQIISVALGNVPHALHTHFRVNVYMTAKIVSQPLVAFHST